MILTYDKNFSKSLDKINDSIILKKIKKVIETCESANDLSTISNLKKLKGYKNCYRIKFQITELELLLKMRFLSLLLLLIERIFIIIFYNHPKINFFNLNLHCLKGVLISKIGLLAEIIPNELRTGNAV